ncbi:hypothetical protein FRX31_015761 [Thalictrum thalictroides]|uniref:Ubiquitin-like domain-containing protein n=1 Tax=Thalictrum thalictroides TaxID=46969 RepID=A0A7J6WCR0_THATH|nr:hypothetical protein FRX31_015761 [Thalictrum thalictroides]
MNNDEIVESVAVGHPQNQDDHINICHLNCGVQDKKPCVKVMMDDKVSEEELTPASTLEKELKMVQDSTYIFVKRIDGKTMQVQVNRLDTSETVKAKIIHKWGVPDADLPKNWRLTYKSKTLKSGRTLADQDIEEHCTLQMSFYICGCQS